MLLLRIHASALLATNQQDRHTASHIASSSYPGKGKGVNGGSLCLKGWVGSMVMSKKPSRHEQPDCVARKESFGGLAAVISYYTTGRWRVDCLAAVAIVPGLS